MYKVLLIK